MALTPAYPDNQAVRELRDEIKDFNATNKEFIRKSNTQTDVMIGLTIAIFILTCVMAWFAYEQYLVALDKFGQNEQEAYRFCRYNPEGGQWPIIGGGFKKCAEVLEILKKSNPQLFTN